MKKRILAFVAAAGLTPVFAAGWSHYHYEAETGEGNWTCSLTFGDREFATTNWVKAESRRLMLDKITTKPGEFVTKLFTVNTRNLKLADGSEVRVSGSERRHERWDDKLTLDVFSQKGPGPVETRSGEDALASFDFKRVTLPTPPVTVFIAGDSTVCCYNTEPYGTWGQMLPAFFDETVAIANHAQSGRSLISFKGDKRQDKVFDQAKPGDWLMIQFGHNDQKEKVEFDERMRRYNERLSTLIDTFRSKGGKVVLVSPMERRRFNAEHKPYHTLAEYDEAMAAMAKAKNCPYINLNKTSFELYETMGEEGSKALFGMRKELDNTHHSVYGGYELARAVVEGIKAEVPELAAHLRPGIAPWTPTSPDPDPCIPRSGEFAKEKPDEK